MPEVYHRHLSMANRNSSVNLRNEVFLSLFVTCGMMLTVVEAFSAVQDGARPWVWL